MLGRDCNNAIRVGCHRLYNPSSLSSDWVTSPELICFRWTKARMHCGALWGLDSKERGERSSEADDSGDQRSRQLPLLLWCFHYLVWMRFGWNRALTLQIQMADAQTACLLKVLRVLQCSHVNKTQAFCIIKEKLSESSCLRETTILISLNPTVLTDLKVERSFMIDAKRHFSASIYLWTE